MIITAASSVADFDTSNIARTLWQLISLPPTPLQVPLVVLVRVCVREVCAAIQVVRDGRLNGFPFWCVLFDPRVKSSRLFFSRSTVLSFSLRRSFVRSLTFCLAMLACGVSCSPMTTNHNDYNNQQNEIKPQQTNKQNKIHQRSGCTRRLSGSVDTVIFFGTQNQ